MKKLLLLVLMISVRAVSGCDVDSYGSYQLGDKVLEYYVIQRGACWEPVISVFDFVDGKPAGVRLARHNLISGIISFDFAENDKGVFIKNRLGVELIPFTR